MVTHHGYTTVSHHLRLVPIRQKVGHIVPKHIPRLFGDQGWRFQDISLGRVFLPDRFKLFIRMATEHVLEQAVQRGTVLDRSFGSAPLVQNRHRRTICLGFPDRIFVYEIAKDLSGPLLLTHDDRGAGKPDPCTVRQSGHQVCVEIARLCPMRLIDHHDDRLVLVQYLEGRPSGNFGHGFIRPVFLDHGEYQTRPLPPRQLLQRVIALRQFDHIARQRHRLGQLSLQVLAVSDHEHLELPQGQIRAHLANHEHHGQTFARALRVPDDTATAIILAILHQCLADTQSFERTVHSAVLLISTDRLDGLAVQIHKQQIVPQDIQKMCGAKHSGDKAFLLRKALLSQCGRYIIFRASSIWPHNRLPPAVVIQPRTNAAHTGLIEACGNQ
ncbi:hypothetical protein GLUCOINTEAF2_0203792 [Komagataeibacter intermedius AF2]|uniref:Uncharacterized protein n=1 Tax=Komagataeibacter intermedius AF2 TaxID=1458464 RepID=A0A0N1FC61_9PROT|nr:hypothetical protein GLUCOINTEAF2_0203792 [Komagataeibacter intermedius AF2]